MNAGSHSDVLSDLVSGREVLIECWIKIVAEVNELFRQCSVFLQNLQGKTGCRIFSRVHNISVRCRYKIMDKQIFFKNDYSKFQKWDKLDAKRLGLFTVTKLIGRNSFRLVLLGHVKIHSVIFVVHTNSYFETSQDIKPTVTEEPASVLANEVQDHVFNEVLIH